MDRKILVYGSSISWGAWDKEGGWVERLKQYVIGKTIDSWDEYFCILYNLGISGDTSSGILERFEKELLNRYNDTDQELVIVIEVGINDSLFMKSENEFLVPKQIFKANVEKLFEIAKRYTEKIIFVGGPPVVDELLDPIPWHTTGTYKTSFVIEYNKILSGVCKERGGVYIDIVEPYGKGNMKETMSPDGVHPSSQGHEIIYEEIKQLLNEKGWI